jgi:prepilin-type N-terminal cleavage/methylation domain-containing protein
MEDVLVMTPRRSRARSEGGFSMAELLVVCAIIGILATMTTPFFLRYYQSAALKAATEELAAFINQGRQIAIKQNTPVCVHTATGSIHFHINGCAGATWTGPGTDSSGNLIMPTGFTLANSADPIFNYLGAASPAATYTVTNTKTTKTLSVTVAASGRILIGP